MNQASAKAEVSYQSKISNIRDKILEIVYTEWPCTPSEIAEKLGLDPKVKKNLLYVKYYVEQLIRDGKLKYKRIGSAIVVWPIEIEKLRLVHELIKEI